MSMEARFTIRQARVDDAPVIAQAEREIELAPGFVVSRPSEMTDEKFATKITELANAEMEKGTYNSIHFFS